MSNGFPSVASRTERTSCFAGGTRAKVPSSSFTSSSSSPPSGSTRHPARAAGDAGPAASARRSVAPTGDDDQEAGAVTVARATRASDDVAEQLERAPIGPVQVVEHEDSRPIPRRLRIARGTER